MKLDTTSERAAAMAGEGWEILRSLERDRPEDWRRLADWLRRVRELLAQPAARCWRGFWWR